MQRQIFRTAALERLSSPEQLDQLMQVTTLKGWLALAALSVVLVAAGIWAIAGRVPVQVVGPGIFLRASGVTPIVAASAGQIDSLALAVGDVVEEGQVVATIRPLDGRTASAGGTATIVSPFRGRVLEITVNRGSLINPATPIAHLESLSDPLEMVVYLPARDGKQVRPGMPVRIETVGARRGESGSLRGTVRTVGQFPSTRAGMMRLLQNDRLVQDFLASGAPVEVRVGLPLDGASWSGQPLAPGAQTSAGPGSGTLGTATITLSERRPVGLVLPLNDE